MGLYRDNGTENANSIADFMAETNGLKVEAFACRIQGLA